jgi:hypothetical protein
MSGGTRTYPYASSLNAGGPLTGGSSSEEEERTAGRENEEGRPAGEVEGGLSRASALAAGM